MSISLSTSTVFLNEFSASLLKERRKQCRSNATFVGKKRQLFFVLQMRLPSARTATVESTMPTSSRASILASPFLILNSTNHRTVTFARSKKHNRFLLTGVKLSAAAFSYEAATSSSGSQSEKKIKSAAPKEVNYQSNTDTNCSELSSNPSRDNGLTLPVGEQGSNSTGSISEYLMETLPGWHVEDFLDPSSHYGFCKIDEHESSFSDEESRCNSDLSIQTHAYMLGLYNSSDSNSI